MRTVIINAHLVPGDGSAEVPGAHLVIEDGVITGITTGEAPAVDATVLDATGLVAMPGMVDSHRHVWQAPFRGIGADLGLQEYFGILYGRALPAFSPDDARAAALYGAMEAIDAGVTTVFDWSNTTVSAEHTDAVLDGYAAAGIRAVVGHTVPSNTADVEQLAKRDGLITGALAVLGPEVGAWDDTVREIAYGRELGVTISMHVLGGPGGAVVRLDEAGLLGPDLHIVHLNKATDQEAARLAGTGTGVTVTPVIEATQGHGHSAYGRLLTAGVRPALGLDTVVAATPDLFESLRDTLRSERMRTGDLVPAAGFLPAATSDSARAIGLGERVGTLAAGMRADVLLLDGLAHLATPSPRAGAIVTTLGPANVRTVLIDGRIVKRDGRLVDHDFAALRGAVGHLAGRAGV